MFNLENILELTNELDSIINIFKKNPNRTFSKKYIEDKRERFNPSKFRRIWKNQ